MASLSDLAVTLSEDEKRLVAQKIAAFTPDEAMRLLPLIRQEALSRCAEEGWFWLQWVRTRDEADPEHSIKAFPVHLEYVKSLWDVLMTRQRVVVAKSRQMLVSWILCAFCVWWARFKPNQAIYWQTQRAEDANEKVCLPIAEGGYMGRCQFIERNLPTWMRQTTKESEGKLSWPNGSMIQALAGGADQVRGKVASIIVEDEFAYQPEAAGVYAAVGPLIQKATRFIAVSTPNREDNCFAQLYFGRTLERAA